MRMTQHGDALVQLTRLPRLFPVNCYLVREDDGFTLIDTALPGSAPAILAAAWALGAPIVRIALTHAHGDHVGTPGDRVGSLAVIVAPGHTPGHVAFLDTRDRTLIAGDAFQTRGGVAVAGTL